MDDDWKFAVIMGVMYIIFSAVIFYGFGHNAGIAKLQQEAIEHNAAEYDSVTSEWRWKQSAAENNK